MRGSIRNPWANQRFEIPEESHEILKEFSAHGEKKPKAPFLRQMDMFLFAAALGAKVNKSENLKKKKMQGFVDGSVLQPDEVDLLWYLAASNNKIDLNDLTDHKAVKDIVEGYAAHGLKLLEVWFNTAVDPAEVLAEKLAGEFPKITEKKKATKTKKKKSS